MAFSKLSWIPFVSIRNKNHADTRNASATAHHTLTAYDGEATGAITSALRRRNRPRPRARQPVIPTKSLRRTHARNILRPSRAQLGRRGKHRSLPDPAIMGVLGCDSYAQPSNCASARYVAETYPSVMRFAIDNKFHTEKTAVSPGKRSSRKPSAINITNKLESRHEPSRL